MRKCLLLCVLIFTPVAAAQSDLKDAKLDCALFSKKTDGSWFLNAQATIELGTSKITLPPGEIKPRMLQFGMVDLNSVLENSCADRKAEPTQGPRKER